MSGGVDSAVAAARAVDAGHDVTGVHLALSRNPQSYRTGARGCCTIEDAHDARRAADVIGIPFYVWDLAERFHEDVVEDFVARVRRRPHPQPVPALQREDQVRRGPRPGARARLRRGRTGHYARLRPATTARSSCTGRSTPARTSPTCSACSTSEQLAHSLFPLGDSPKAEVRAEAGRRGLRSPTSRTATTSASSPTATPPACCATGSATGTGRHRRRRDGEVLGAHDGAFALHRRPAQGPAARPAGRRRPAALRARHRAGVRHRHGRAARGADRRPGRRASGRAGAAPPRPSRCTATVQLRAHGERAPGRRCTVDRRRASVDRAARPGAGHRARPGRGALRRHRVVGSCTITGDPRTAASRA